MRSGKFLLSIIVSLGVFLLGVYLFLPSFSRPALSSPFSATLTVISDDVFLRKADSDWQRVEKQASVEEGDWVKTSSQGRAVITFFEYSSTEIEPDTTICLEELFSTLKGSSIISINQQAGHTWNSIGKMFDPASRFEVSTSAAAAVVRGTLIDVGVEEDGNTTVEVFAGEAGVSGQGQEVSVLAGWQTTVNPGEPPSPPSLIPPPLSQLTISTGPLAWLQVVDPLGRNIGTIPPGFGVNRIPFSNVTFTDEEQMVSINEPVSGTYYIALYAHNSGTVQVTANTTSQDGFSQQESREFEITEDWGYYITLDLEVDEEGSIVSTVMGEVRALPPDFITEKFYGIKYRSYLS